MKTCGLHHIQTSEFCDKHLTTRMVRREGLSFPQSRLGAVAAMKDKTPNRKIATPRVLSSAECARRTGVTVRTLRVYERVGLITPQRGANGWRIYGEREILRAPARRPQSKVARQRLEDRVRDITPISVVGPRALHRIGAIAHFHIS
jgi:hypothetical protein